VPAIRRGIPRPGSTPDAFAGLAKINVETGAITRIHTGRAPGNGAVLATAGGLVFWGDLAGKLRAFDAASGGILWEETLGGTIQNSTITYAVNGTQYLAVLTGEGLLTGGLLEQAGLTDVPRRYNALHVFALP
jgi:outer membrane protein assembly factor BamB